MPTSSVQGASVEGEKLGLKTRKFYHIPPTKDPATKKTRWGFKLGMNSLASIEEAYESKEQSVYESSMLVKGDAVQAESIHGWSLKPFGEPNISKGSGTHSASHLGVTGGCFAKVIVTPRHLLQDAEFMKKNPAITPKIREIEAPKLDVSDDTRTDVRADASAS